MPNTCPWAFVLYCYLITKPFDRIRRPCFVNRKMIWHGNGNASVLMLSWARKCGKTTKAKDFFCCSVIFGSHTGVISMIPLASLFPLGNLSGYFGRSSTNLNQDGLVESTKKVIFAFRGKSGIQFWFLEPRSGFWICSSIWKSLQSTPLDSMRNTVLWTLDERWANALHCYFIRKAFAWKIGKFYSNAELGRDKKGFGIKVGTYHIPTFALIFHNLH